MYVINVQMQVMAINKDVLLAQERIQQLTGEIDTILRR